MKWYILPFVCIFLIPLSLACDPSNYFSLCKNDSNNICDPGEIPMMDEDCSYSNEEIVDGDFFNHGWFIKGLLLGLAIYLFYKGILLDPAILVFFLVMFFAFTVLPSSEYIKNDYEAIEKAKDLNSQNVTDDQGSYDKTWDSIQSLPDRIFPGKPLLSWIFIIFLGGVLLWGIDKLMDMGLKK